MNGQYRPGDVVLGKWTLKQLIGEGSFGKVFAAEREDFGRTYKAAIKIVTIPQSQSEVQSIRADGLDDESVTTYFRGFVEEMVGEFALMEQLKGTANVVGYEDHEVLPHENQVGWDIFIRMELLTPLLRQVQSGPLSREQVLRLGIDLCRALELCRKHKIVHRDIKPENIFVSENGDYKLGDFGIARTVEKTTGGLSKKGTYTYMAPEVYKGKPYGASADLYSLGLVLYWLTNRHRAPFLPLPPDIPGYNDREEALRRRMKGEALPAPCNADAPLAAIIQKACAYAVKDRYKSPTELRQELEALLTGPQTPPEPVAPEGTIPIFSGEGTESLFGDTPSEPEGTESLFGDTPPEPEGTESLFGDTPPEPEGTESLFGDTPPEPEGTESLFGEVPLTGEIFESFFGQGADEVPPPKPEPPKKAKKEPEPSTDRLQLVTEMLPACATVPLGPNRTTQALFARCSPKERKVLDNILKKYKLQQYGEILGYCGVILNITIPYAVMFTTTGVLLPVALKVSRFLLDVTVRHTYVHLPYSSIQALSLCTEKNLQGIAITLGGGQSQKMILPQDIYIHRTNVCKLIQALGRAGGYAISFQA